MKSYGFHAVGTHLHILPRLSKTSPSCTLLMTKTPYTSLHLKAHAPSKEPIWSAQKGQIQQGWDDAGLMSTGKKANLTIPWSLPQAQHVTNTCNWHYNPHRFPEFVSCPKMKVCLVVGVCFDVMFLKKRKKKKKGKPSILKQELLYRKDC